MAKQNISVSIVNKMDMTSTQEKDKNINMFTNNKKSDVSERNLKQKSNKSKKGK